MRSRTELVTTTFIDSEEEQTESDDSEEDWRPESSRSGKKRPTRGKRRNKRKAATAARLLAKKKMVEIMKEAEDSDEGGFQKIYPATGSSPPNVAQAAQLRKAPEKPPADFGGAFSLYLYKKDLDKDYRSNSHLCLWRRDGSSLLQKYIRVKTSNCEEFIFTSSSVYSSWDERRRKDFATVIVKCVEDNNRRIVLQNPECLQSLAEEATKHKLLKAERLTRGEDDSTNEILDSQDEEEEEEEEDYDDEDEEESGEDDMNSAKTSDGEDEYSGGEEGSTNEGASCS